MDTKYNAIDREAVNNRREYIRYNLEARVMLEHDGVGTVDGDLRDISVGGMFVETPMQAEFSQGDAVAASLEFVAEGVDVALTCLCKVARVTKSGVGLFFVNIDAQGKKALSSMLRDIRENTK